MIKSIIGQITRPSSLYEYHDVYWVESCENIEGCYFVYQRAAQNKLGIWVTRDITIGRHVRMQKVPYKPTGRADFLAFTLPLFLISAIIIILKVRND